jgi:hypothetical protein
MLGNKLPTFWFVSVQFYKMNLMTITHLPVIALKWAKSQSQQSQNLK